MSRFRAVNDETSRYIVAVDFGTTFSSVAYCRVTKAMKEEGSPLNLGKVQCIQNYPYDRPLPGTRYRREPREDVPTELWYTTLPPSISREARSEPDGSESMDWARFDDDGDDDEDEQVATNPRQRLGAPYWGFGVQDQLRQASLAKNDACWMKRFKLLLENSEHTEHVRGTLKETARELKRAKLIEKDTDVISEFLTRLFSHTKHELRRQERDYNDSTPIEFVLCVPPLWSPKACRIMQTAMSVAIQHSGLSGLADAEVDNLFIVSEPEAAAAYVLEETGTIISAGETIVVIDAGGGTVDAATYRVSSSFPLRLSKEVVASGSALCGSSFINERFEQLLLERLSKEHYLEHNGKTINSIVAAAVMQFENCEKRFFGSKKKEALAPIEIDNLRPNQRKRFGRNEMYFKGEEMKKVFLPSALTTTELLKRQLDSAKESNACVEKVILIGGFGQSKFLQNYLKSFLQQQRNLDNEPIELVHPESTATAVARGAILRAYDKSHGPSRLTKCSYGFRISEPYDNDCAAHLRQQARYHPLDGTAFIDDAIEWLIQEGDRLELKQEFFIKNITFVMEPSLERLVCKQKIYVSDRKHDQHYRLDHNKNRGAELAGTIKADMSILRDEGYIRPEPGPPTARYPNGCPDLNYRISIDIGMIVDGRNLYYKAYWPSGEPTKTVWAEGRLCIASAFNPGTL